MASWTKKMIMTDAGNLVEAVCPVIISASRSTDIPACYSDWFMHRFLDKGYLVWTNPFNRKPTHISFQKTRVIVFWTKNPSPMMQHLDKLDERGVNYYFQCTLNDYEDVGFEPNIPSLEYRVADFKALSNRIGKRKVIWRFDPIILTNGLDASSIIKRIKKVGDEVHRHTERMVFSFVDLKAYRKLSLPSVKEGFREPDEREMIEISSGIKELNKEWGLELNTCGEDICLSQYDIKKGRCVDGDLMLSLFPNDIELVRYLEKNNRKDKGQREACGCIESKDIGEYDTCPNLCKYCYANSSRQLVIKNLGSHNRNRLGETITGNLLRKINDGDGKQIKLA